MCFVLAFADNDYRHLRTLAGGGQEGFEGFSVDNRHSRFTILNVMDVIGGTRVRIYGHGQGADFGGGEKRGDEFRGIRKHDENAVPPGYA